MKNVKVLIAVLALCAVIFLIFVGVGVADRVKYAGYEKVEAELVELERLDSKRVSNNLTKTYYAVYEYTVDGEEYTAKRQILSPNGKAVGDIETVRYDPSDPAVLENELLGGTYWAIVVFLAVFMGLLCLVIRNNKRR